MPLPKNITELHRQFGEYTKVINEANQARQKLGREIAEAVGQYPELVANDTLWAELRPIFKEIEDAQKRSGR
jgi:hypothetical protein